MSNPDMDPETVLNQLNQATNVRAAEERPAQKKYIN